MWLVRPAEPDDLDQILAIAGTQCARLSSTLPKQGDALAYKIEQSLASFAGRISAEDDPPRFLFVLEDTETGDIAGTAGIDAHAGNGQPFYSYRRDALIHASHELGVSRRVEVLYPSHSLTDVSLLCSFSIRPELQGTDAFEAGNGKLQVLLRCQPSHVKHCPVLGLQSPAITQCLVSLVGREAAAVNAPAPQVYRVDAHGLDPGRHVPPPRETVCVKILLNDIDETLLDEVKEIGWRGEFAVGDEGS